MTSGSDDLWHDRLDVAATRSLVAWHELVDRADPQGHVEGRSRRLCAALGELAGVTLDALATDAPASLRGRVVEAAAGLSLLTKIDDQVIDGPAFHGVGARETLRARTRAYLAPTLMALRTPPLDADPRSALAAEVGRRLRVLAADAQRLDDTLMRIAQAWETQVDAVAVFTAHPRDTSDLEVDDVTARVSGHWISIICAVGALTRRSSRGLNDDERAAILRWGRYIQQADALADLPRDLGDGLRNTSAVRAAWRRFPASVELAFDQGDRGAVDQLVAAHGLDLPLRPDAATRAALARQPATLGQLPSLLGWVLELLLGRFDVRAARR